MTIKRSLALAAAFSAALTLILLAPARGQGNAPPLEPNLGWLNTDRPLSFEDDLKGHVVLLDFWTYCCINCMHVLPDLEYLEEKYADEPFVVIGVHSAKFTTEAERRSIRNAMFRYDIHHPVVVDDDMQLWRAFGARAWPTFVLVDPEGQILGFTSGEGKRDLLDQVIKQTLEIHREKGTLAENKIEINLDEPLQSPSGLNYPGKVLALPPTDTLPAMLATADSSNDRIILAAMPDAMGRAEVLHLVGSGERGYADGAIDQAQFNDPQGMAYDVEAGILYIADTRNHAIRAVDLNTRLVTTIAGTGTQGYDRSGGAPGAEQIISSPWDVLLSPDRETLYVAMAGPHQLWSVDLSTPDRVTRAIAGSGAENIIDGRALDAALAQPSGVALSTDGTKLYFADTEGSAIRVLDLEADTVSTIIGRAVDSPWDSSLFDYGDIDGVYPDARLQHAIGITLYPTNEGDRLLVADTYNDKLKLIDPAQKRVTSWLGASRDDDTSDTNPAFEEPAGVDYDEATGALYVADTNRHRVVRVNTRTKAWTEIVFDGLEPERARSARSLPSSLIAAELSAGSSVAIAPKLPVGYKLNQDLPVAIRVSQIDGDTIGDALLQRTLQPGESFPVAFDLPQTDMDTLLIEVSFAFCDESNTICIPADLAWRVAISPDAKSQTLTGAVAAP